VSQEGKQKRGTSGLRKAASIPFRHNGWPADWWARRAGATQVGPSVDGDAPFARGVIGGLLARVRGFGFTLTEFGAARFDDAMKRCSAWARIADNLERE